MPRTESEGLAGSGIGLIDDHVPHDVPARRETTSQRGVTVAEPQRSISERCRRCGRDGRHIETASVYHEFVGDHAFDGSHLDI